MCFSSWVVEGLSEPTSRLKLRKLVVSVVVAFMSTAAPTALASNKTPQQVLCEVYENVYENANKSIASIDVKGIADNSAPRESNRQLKMLNERILQLIVIQQMQAHGCKVPKAISTGAGYMTDAVKCRTEQLKGNVSAPECDQTKWNSSFDDLEHFQ